MKTIIYYIFLFCVPVLSCVDEHHNPDIELPPPPPQTGFATLTIELPEVKEPLTYAVGETDENMIETVDVLAFKLIEDKYFFSYRLELSGHDITDVSGSVNGEQKEFDVEIRKDSLCFVIIANGKGLIDQLSELMFSAGVTKEELLDSIQFSQSGKWPVAPGSFAPFPMWGETKDLIRITTTAIATVPLLRAVVRIDVGVDVFGDPALGFGNKFKLKDVYIYNAMNKGYIAPDMSDPGLEEEGFVVTIPHIPQDAVPITTPLKYEYADNSEVVQRLFREIYIAESGVDNVCLVISGYYDNGPESFYKIAFAQGRSYFPLLRNYRYLVNIKGIRRQGYASAAEAYAAEPSNMVNDIVLGDIYVLTEFEFNGQYMLATDGSRKTIDWQQQNVEVLVNTTYSGGWTATIDQGALSWISMINGSGTGSLYENDVMIVNVARNTDAFVREGKITLHAGSLSKEIHIKQRLGANCYILKPHTGMVEIPVAFANADGNIRVTSGSNIDASILWTDASDVVGSPVVTGTGVNSLIRVEANNEGNALIAAVDLNSNSILWSWHIWVTDYDPDYIGNQVNNNKVVFMDRNLGALNRTPGDINAFGLYYQWGRKDPFPGPAAINLPDDSYDTKPLYDASGNLIGVTCVEVSQSDNLENSIRNPMILYYNSVYPHNWYPNGHNNLWTNHGEKTPYDPSPDGWKVPESGVGTYSPWYGYTTNGLWDYGWIWNGDVYYPAVGGRGVVDGSFRDVGQRGGVWSATPHGFQAYSFSFGPQGVIIDASLFRAISAPVRCVKDTD